MRAVKGVHPLQRTWTDVWCNQFFSPFIWNRKGKNGFEVSPIRLASHLGAPQQRGSFECSWMENKKKTLNFHKENWLCSNPCNISPNITRIWSKWQPHSPGRLLPSTGSTRGLKWHSEERREILPSGYELNSYRAGPPPNPYREVHHL